ncbi:MAG: chorismate synthase [Eubacterium sp.]|nr:chorismate synthase [Eubacterium sp.]
MAGSDFGKIFKTTTWGESHGAGIGAVVDGCPAGLPLEPADIQAYLDRRKPGQSRYTTARSESDQVEILSGVFDGVTTGTPISMLVRNHDQHSKDYSALKDLYRPGHADFGYEMKYGVRDYRGGGRSSGRETIGRVAGGAVAAKLLAALGISVTAYTKSIGPVTAEEFDEREIRRNPLCMPDAAAAKAAAAYLETCMAAQDSAGGIIECVVRGMPAGAGDPVFEKLDANLAKAVMSVGAVKGVEIGDGFAAAASVGSANNDAFVPDAEGTVDKITKATNHSGGILGGISDGSDIILRAAIKPTPSIARGQRTVNRDGSAVDLSITGRHDPVIVPRAVVVVECMAALVIADALLAGMSARLDSVKAVWKR